MVVIPKKWLASLKIILISQNMFLISQKLPYSLKNVLNPLKMAVTPKYVRNPSKIVVISQKRLLPIKNGSTNLSKWSLSHKNGYKP